MDDTTTEKERAMLSIEDVMIGDRSSRISGAIFFLLCFLPAFSMVLFGATDSMTWVLISVFWAAIIMLWLVEAWKGKGFPVNPSALQIPLLGLLLIGIVQLLPLVGSEVGDLLSVPVSHSLSIDPSATRFFMIRLVVYLVFFAACLTFVNNERRLKKLVVMLIVFGAVMAFVAILFRLANPEGIYGIRVTPNAIPFGPFFNQHHFAAFTEMTGGLTLGLLFGKTTGRDKKALLAIAIVIMGAAIGMTGSRGGMLGFGSVLAFVALLNFVLRGSNRETGSEAESLVGVKQKIAMTISSVALIFVIFGVVLFVGGNDPLLRGLGVGIRGGDVSTGRFHFWTVAIKIFLEHPLLGAGFDAFGSAFTKYDTWSGLIRVDQAHNEYLQTLADSGIAGLICVVGFIYLLFTKSVRTIANAASSFRKNAAIGALAGCFGIIIHSFFDFPLRTHSNTFFFLILCAIATVSISSNSSGSARRSRSSTAP